MTLTAGCDAALTDVVDGAFNHSQPHLALTQLCALAEHSMGGTSGNLLQEFLSAAASAAADGHGWRGVLVEGTAAVQDAGGAVVGDRTAVDALVPAAAAAAGGAGAAEVAAAAEAGADGTAAMRKARFGRAAHVNADRLAGNADPGAVAVAVALRAFCEARGEARLLLTED